MKFTKSNRFKLVLSMVIANAIRLIRIIPNNDPIMSMALPFSRRSSALTSLLFPLITMASFDIVTNSVGPWTAVTAATYGLIGLGFHYFLKGREKAGIKTYLGCGIGSPGVRPRDWSDSDASPLPPYDLHAGAGGPDTVHSYAPCDHMRIHHSGDASPGQAGAPELEAGRQ